MTRTDQARQLAELVFTLTERSSVADVIETALTEVQRETQRAERERCAKIADNMDPERGSAVAALIRQEPT